MTDMAMEPKPGLLFKPWKRDWISGLPIGAEFQTRHVAKPRYDVGDVLYHREPLTAYGPMSDRYATNYAAYADKSFVEPPMLWRWPKASIGQMHMPMEAARAWYRVAEVRRERLSCLSYEDSLAEGVKAMPGKLLHDLSLAAEKVGPVGIFMALWDSINKAPGMQSKDNPEITVYRMVRCYKDGSTEPKENGDEG